MHAGDCDSLHLPLRWYGGCIIFDSVVGELVSSPHPKKKVHFPPLPFPGSLPGWATLFLTLFLTLPSLSLRVDPPVGPLSVDCLLLPSFSPGT